MAEIKSKTQIRNAILRALVEEMNPFFKEAAVTIKPKVASLVHQRIIQSEEMASLQDGVLRFDIGLTSGQASQAVNMFADAISNAVNVSFRKITKRGKGLGGGFTVDIQPEGFANIDDMTPSWELSSGKRASVKDLLLNLGDGIVIYYELEKWIYSICGGYPVAVRSSAASEDGVSTSFAGQYDTVLNCNNASEVLEALEKVYKSGSSNRVQSYVEAQLSLTERGQDSSLEICAVVQHMVKATVSGVMFTAEPVESDTSQIFIEAVSGLGDKMVSGYASPDSWLFDKYSGNIIESYSMSTPVLERDQLEELFDTGKQIEAEFGCPQDIEWAFDRNKLFILQTRPITTLSKV